MSDQQKDESRYFYGIKPDEQVVQRHAARTAEANCQYMLPALQKMVQSNPKLKLLDAGCGPGSITLSLARYIPEGELIGIDFSDSVLEKARELAKEQGVTNVSFQTADVYSLPFEDETFDVVHTHQAVAHFHEHVRAIKELIRVTKKGGMVCMREGDLYTARFYPDSPLLDESFQTIRQTHEKQGIFADAGRRLRAWTVEAGVPTEKIIATAGAWCYSTLEERREFGGGRILKGKTAEKAIELGIMTRERVKEFEEAWKRWEEDESGIFTLTHGQVIALI